MSKKGLRNKIYDELQYPGNLSLTDLSLNELKALCKSMGIFTKGLNKNQICNEIQKFLYVEPIRGSEFAKVQQKSRNQLSEQSGGKKIIIKKRLLTNQRVPPNPVEYYSWVEGGEYEGPQNQKYILPNNTKFPAWILENYNKYQLSEEYQWNCDDLEKGTGKRGETFPYQDFIREYMSYESPYRGILLYYGLGAGKTRAALEIGRMYHESLGWEVIFISPAGLVDNFVEEMGKWGIIPKTEAERIISLKTRTSRVSALKNHGFYIVSYDAPNKGAQLRQALEQGSGENKSKRIRNKVIIVDEVHNMAQFIHNGLNQNQSSSKKARAKEFYDILYGATNCRMVFLSGTPMINVPSELAILFNILRGPMKFRPRPENIKEPKVLNQQLPNTVKNKKGYFPVFPVEKENFDNEFIDWRTLSILPKRDELFKQRIMGLVAYYSGARGDVYPELILGPEGEPWTLVMVPMSSYQTQEYERVRYMEREEKKKKKTKGVGGKALKVVPQPMEAEVRDALESTQDKIDSTFRIKSRQISNFALPPELREIRPNSISAEPEQLEELYNQMTILAAGLEDEEENENNIFKEENLIFFSPKMHAMLDKIENIRGTPQDGNILIYSNFRSLEGIELFARVLESNGYEWFDPENPDITPVGPYEEPRFAILGKDYRTGGKDLTTEIIKIFNSEENRDGKIIKILLGTSNISEGLSLFNIRMVLVMEPHWNMVRINQVIGRARRICSHRSLPRDKWNFQVFIFVTVVPDDPELAKLTADTQSTDMVLYEIAQGKEKVKNQFIHLIKEAAVDCMLNATHNRNLEQDPPVKCLTFPNSQQLIYSYFPDIQDDLGRGTQAIRTREEETGWVPFTDIQHSRFIDKKTNTPKFAIEKDPITKKDVMTQLKINSEGSKGKVYIAKALYDRVQLEHSGEFILKGYLVSGKPAWPLISQDEITEV